jgi:hypothetical protein
MKIGDVVLFKEWADDIPAFRMADGTVREWNVKTDTAIICILPPQGSIRYGLFLPSNTGHSLNNKLPEPYQERGWYAFPEEIEVISYSENKAKIFKDFS